MNRKDFLVKGCIGCLSALAVSSGFISCSTTTQYLSGKLGKDGITLVKADFKLSQRGNTDYRSFVIVRNDALKFPICVYRHDENNYSALWMQCAHQGAELQASGDMLTCPAHGSEFNNKGVVTNGPASRNLKTFPVTITDNVLFIDMRKQS